MADKVNLVIDQGTTYSVDFEVKDANNEIVDLTNYTGAGQIRKHYTSNTAVSFTVNAYSNGVVRAALTANQTSSLSEGRYVYDIELTDIGSEVSRIVEGIITVTPEVTK